MTRTRLSQQSLSRRRAAGAALSFALLGWKPLFAQTAATLPRVGFVSAGHPKDVAAREAAFRAGMRELGYEHGRNVIIDVRYGEERPERLPALIEDLLRSKVDVIVSAGPPVTRAARQVTSSVPIVMGFDPDPISSGAVASLARPGGNVTGLSILGTDLTGKQLEYLKAVVPKLARVAVLWHPTEPFSTELLRTLRQAAAALGVAVDMHDVSDPARIEGAFAAARADGADGVIVMSNPLVVFHRARFAQAASANRLPTIYPTTEPVDAGGLMSYGAAIDGLFHRAATYVDRILRGAKASELPVELPRSFVLVVNIPAATRIGLTIPPSVLARADRVVH